MINKNEHKLINVPLIILLHWKETSRHSNNYLVGKIDQGANRLETGSKWYLI